MNRFLTARHFLTPWVGTNSLYGKRTVGFISLASPVLRACDARALPTRNTLTPLFTDFFTYFAKKPTVFAAYERICSWAKPAKRWPLYRLYTQACFSLSVNATERKRPSKKFNDSHFVIDFFRNLKTFRMIMEICRGMFCSTRK